MFGWQCPKCRRVYSPEVRECAPCNAKIVTDFPVMLQWPTDIKVQPDCGCPPLHVCGNSACPRRITIVGMSHE